MLAPGRQTVVDVIVDQGPLRLGHRAFDGVQLRGKINARSPFLYHGDYPPQVSLGAF